ncbi:MAG: SCP2 sterol-binding domain-containing protein [Chloroflexi bacterium]|nr:SCP2 sterol-binding domain-containing protein [Chloroflexota bacterium]MBP8058977.1 SCP2 sterol-binding domain-containing protein [Chloroflexota bacterium]
MDVEQIFANLPKNVDVSKLGDFKATVVFSLTGEGGGEWQVNIADGKVTTEKASAEKPTAKVTMDADDYKNMMSGKLNPVQAFMSGKVRVEGDLNAVMKLQSMFKM